MNRRHALVLGPALVLAFLLGTAVAPHAAEARAATPRAPIALGSPAADVIAVDGHPVRINYDEHVTQTWFYMNAEGIVSPRYAVNQGLIVKIFGTPAR